MNKLKPYQVIAKKSSMTHQQWLDLKSKTIGGSEAAAAIGLNPYRSQFDLFLEKCGFKERKTEQNEAMYWGNRLEKIVAEEVAIRNPKWEVHHPDAMFQSTKYPWMTANIDGFIDLGTDTATGKHEYAVLEIKTTSAFNSAEWDDSQSGGAASVPIAYYIQCHWYMECLGLKKAVLACLAGGNNYKQVTIDYDPDIARVMIEKASEFVSYVSTRTAPPLTSRDNSILNSLYPSAKLKTISMPIEFIPKLEKLEVIKAQITKLKDDQDLLEAEIKDYMKDSEQAELNGYKVTWKNSSRSSFNTEKAKSYLSEEQLKACTYVTTTRTFRFTKSKPKKSK